jgi:hypothetical protein
MEKKEKNILFQFLIKNRKNWLKPWKAKVLFALFNIYTILKLSSMVIRLGSYLDQGILTDGQWQYG